LSADAKEAPCAVTSPPSTIALLGQVVIRKAVDLSVWLGHEALQNRLANADVVFANMESIINVPRAGTLTRAALTLHAADPSALRTLVYLRIQLLGTANNHAFDLHTDGILNTIEALSAARIPFAGTGRNSVMAAAPAYAFTGATTIAVVAFATGMLRPGAVAGDGNIGVNALRRQANGLAEPDDVKRILGAIHEAKTRADVVIACHHNHDRGSGSDAVPEWQRMLAYQCVDAGATVFASHGVPVLQGVEIYRGVPLFFGLGNFMFQVAKPPGAYEDGAWDGVIALCAFENRRCREVRLLPIVLNETAADGSGEASKRGLPTLATSRQARRILGNLQEKSAVLGTTITMSHGEGVIAPG
jgi:poly-gamma-glutamate synthesis protein (capsule biosynthesis protein)